MTLGLLWGGHVAADGVTVSPGLVHLALPSGAVAADGVINIKNDTSRPVRFVAELHAAHQASDGALVPTDQLDDTLAASLTLNPQDFTVAPEESANVHLRLIDSSALAPGGQYAAVIIRQLGVQENKVSLVPAVSVMLFISKEQGGFKKLSIEELSLNNTIFRLPDTVVASFANQGNIDVVPHASVSIYNPVHQLIRRGTLNDSSIRAYPGQSVQVQGNVTPLARSWLPGRYTASVIYRYDDADHFQEVVRAFWYFPPSFLTLTSLMAACCTGLLAYWRSAKRRRRAARPVPRPVPRKAMDVVVSKKRPPTGNAKR